MFFHKTFLHHNKREKQLLFQSHVKWCYHGPARIPVDASILQRADIEEKNWKCKNIIFVSTKKSILSSLSLNYLLSSDEGILDFEKYPSTDKKYK